MSLVVISFRRYCASVLNFSIQLSCLTLLLSSIALAHEGRPILIEIEQSKDFINTIKYTVPATLPSHSRPSLSLPNNCIAIKQTGLIHSNDAYRYQSVYDCSASISGQKVEIVFKGANPSLSSLIRVRLSQGTILSKMLTPGNTRWTIPTQANSFSVALDYLQLGVIHIWSGVDHLLFVLCLLFLANTKTRIIGAITGFTLAHSLTLFLSALDMISISITATEAIIALSIMFLAAEVIRGKQNTLTWRYPIVVAGIIGLIHGVGFASVLSEIGLPQVQRIEALVSFNIGVELGQILFILVLLLCRAALLKFVVKQNKPAFDLKLKYTTVYTAGIVSAYWFYERSFATGFIDWSMY